jgi:hypothetical protein
MSSSSKFNSGSNPRYLARFWKKLGNFQQATVDFKEAPKARVSNQGGQQEQQNGNNASYFGTKAAAQQVPSSIKPQAIASKAFEEVTNSELSSPITQAKLASTSKAAVANLPSKVKAAVDAMTAHSSTLGKILWALKGFLIVPLARNLWRCYTKKYSPQTTNIAPKNALDLNPQAAKPLISEKFLREENIKVKFSNLDMVPLSDSLDTHFCVNHSQICMLQDGMSQQLEASGQKLIINDANYLVKSEGIYFNDQKIFTPTDNESLSRFTATLREHAKYITNHREWQQDYHQKQFKVLNQPAQIEDNIASKTDDNKNRPYEPLWTDTEATQIKQAVVLPKVEGEDTTVQHKNIFLFLHGSGDGEFKGESSQLTFSHLHQRLKNKTGCSSDYVDGPSAVQGKRATRNIFHGLFKIIDMIHTQVKDGNFDLRLNLHGHSRGGEECIVLNNYLCLLIKNNFNLSALHQPPHTEEYKLLRENFKRLCDEGTLKPDDQLKFTKKLSDLAREYEAKGNAEDHIHLYTVPSDPVTGPQIKLFDMAHEGFKFADKLYTIKNHKVVFPLCTVEHDASKLKRDAFDVTLPECDKPLDVVLLNVEHGHLVRYPLDDGRINHGSLNAYQMYCWMVGLEPEKKILVTEYTELAQETLNAKASKQRMFKYGQINQTHGSTRKFFNQLWQKL